MIGVAIRALRACRSDEDGSQSMGKRNMEESFWRSQAKVRLWKHVPVFLSGPVFRRHRVPIRWSFIALRDRFHKHYQRATACLGQTPSFDHGWRCGLTHRQHSKFDLYVWILWPHHEELVIILGNEGVRKGLQPLSDRIYQLHRPRPRGPTRKGHRCAGG
jgi:hypothetical protein